MLRCTIRNQSHLTVQAKPKRHNRHNFLLSAATQTVGRAQNTAVFAPKAVVPRPISFPLTMQLHPGSHLSNLSLLCFILVLKLTLLRAAVVQPQHHSLDLHWYPGTATWYGDPEGDGSTG